MFKYIYHRLDLQLRLSAKSPATDLETYDPFEAAGTKVELPSASISKPMPNKQEGGLDEFGRERGATGVGSRSSDPRRRVSRSRSRSRGRRNRSRSKSRDRRFFPVLNSCLDLCVLYLPHLYMFLFGWEQRAELRSRPAA